MPGPKPSQPPFVGGSPAERDLQDMVREQPRRRIPVRREISVFQDQPDNLVGAYCDRTVMAKQIGKQGEWFAFVAPLNSGPVTGRYGGHGARDRALRRLCDLIDRELARSSEAIEEGG